mmetsp:Transcript_1399/g.4058  ORF Transcript_1399/g.4058 Transcript_1399/m.4058 type:complete len:361 (+) Transcript_1399:31-1113(+)
MTTTLMTQGTISDYHCAANGGLVASDRPWPPAGGSSVLGEQLKLECRRCASRSSAINAARPAGPPPWPGSGHDVHSRHDSVAWHKIPRTPNACVTEIPRVISVLPPDDVICDRREGGGLVPVLVQSLLRVGDHLLGHLLGPFQAEQFRVRGLVRFEVLARSFAQLLRRGSLVKNIVGHLEGQADFERVLLDICHVLCVRAANDRAARNCSLKERSCLVRVDPSEVIDCHARLALAFDIHRLPTREAHSANARAQSAQHVNGALRGHTGGVLGDVLKGRGQEGIACEDGERLAVEHVVCGLPSAQVIVVHGRKVVVNERHCVDHLKGNGRRHCGLDGSLAAEHLRSSEAEYGTNPLTAGHE